MSRLKNRKARGILDQITRPMVVFELIIMLLCALAVFCYNMKVSLDQRFDTTTQIAEEAVNTLTEYKSIDFLVDYWHENYEQMEFIYDDPEALNAKEMQFSELYPRIPDTELVTSEQAREMDAETQRLFAEICYSRLSTSFDRIKRSFDTMFLYGFIIEGDDMFFIITGTLEDESRISSGGDLFELGYAYPYSRGRYPTLDQLLDTGVPSDHIELSLRADREAVHVFAPVTVNGSPVMYIGVSTQWKDIMAYTLFLSLFLAAIIAVLLATLLVIFFRIINRIAVRPLVKETSIVKEYEANKDSKKATEELGEIRSDNEIEELADAFSSMLSDLESYMEEIRVATADKERLGAELDMAASIQSSQLPSTFPAFPGRNEFSIFASMTPAKTVGGDFYDFFLIDDDHIALVMADVSGKGVPASLFMMISKLLIKNSLQNGKSPAEALTDTNKQLTENNEAKQFVTVWLAVIEISTGKGIAANAGHEHPVLRRAGKDYELVEYKHSVPVATLKKAKFSEHEFELHPGDSLFVYTDGVPEATNAGDELFGNDRMLVALNKNPAAGPRLILKTVKDSVDEFVGEAEQFDDLTMLCFRYNGPESGAKDE